ncbi:MAG TPA: cation:proton antiporter [Gemmatimonadaceae bacterium]|jgi:Kef-type K+ transport system membrane component KefB|nr:cation:proton antiporter [Gemmatimonadaceae bacterium]
MLVAAPPVASAVDPVASLLTALVAIFVATKVLGELAQRLGQPAVLGELIAGVLLGGSVLGIVNPADPVLGAMAQIGVVVLLFETGLHTELRSLLIVGSVATTVGLAGVIIPFALGYASGLAFGLGHIPALVAAAALCATSVGISARVLADLGRLETAEGRVVLGAAVLDDIVGLVILAIIADVVSGAGVNYLHVLRTSVVAILFFAAAVFIGIRVAAPAFGVIERIKTAGALGVFGLAFAFALSVLAKLAGSALIIGAFAAGLVLFGIPQKQEIERSTTTIGHFFVPIFFATVGAAVDLRALTNARSLGIGLALIVCGVGGKILAGYVPRWFRGRKLLVGVAMVPRGEVGLIFAQMGLSTGAIDAGLFGAIMLMVLTTTLVTPPLLGRVARANTTDMFRVAPAGEDRHGDGGIDDLVAGASQAEPPDEQDRSTRAIRRR